MLAVSNRFATVLCVAFQRLIICALSNNPGQSPLVNLDFPAPLQARVVNALEADPKTVDIRAQAPHYYALGAKILELFDDDQIVDVLLKVTIPDIHDRGQLAYSMR